MSARNSLKFLTVLLFCFTVVTGCQTTASNKDTGAILGMVVGGVVGSVFGSGSGQAVAVIVGAATGGIMGAMIGEKLDEADRLQAQAAANAALQVPVGNTVEWRSEENTSIHGTATPIKSSENSDGKECRTVRQVAFINGKEIEETTKFCRIDGSGRWAPT